MKHGEKLWTNKRFPNIVNQYLMKKWRDRFYLFDEKYPFFQVTKEKKLLEIKLARLKQVGFWAKI
ncbi:MAG: type I-E CRISPR-associated protein Cse1/CasA [Streptococcus sp.]|uniref:type I-E CRISPR-associated protein Cse1/CasA n=1 Tax=Streptococcus sp. TaxID=1306 RepID=UPI0039911348